MLKIIHPNYFAILIATLSGIILGIIWYSPFLFRKVWLADIERNEHDIRRTLIPFLISVVGIYILGIILDTFLRFSDLVGYDGFFDVTVIGLIVSIGIIALNMLSDYMISGAHIKFFIVHAGFRIILTLVMSWVLWLLIYSGMDIFQLFRN